MAVCALSLRGRAVQIELCTGRVIQMSMPCGNLAKRSSSAEIAHLANRFGRGLFHLLAKAIVSVNVTLCQLGIASR